VLLWHTPLLIIIEEDKDIFDKLMKTGPLSRAHRSVNTLGHVISTHATIDMLSGLFSVPQSSSQAPLS